MKKFENKQIGILSSSELKTVKGQLLYWIFIVFLTIVSVISLFPAIWTVLTAFKETQEIYSGFSLFPKNMTPVNLWKRVTESWNELQLMSSFINTMILFLGNIFMTIMISGFGGYVLSKLKPTGSRIVFALVIWTMMMPGQMRMVPNYITMLHFPFAYDFGIGVNLMDTFWPLWLGAAANAFYIILFKNAFDGLSQSYIEAARIDGCSNIGIFFKIMFPLSMPIIIYISIMSFSAAWSDFFGPLLYLDKNVVTPLKIYRLQSDTTIEMNTKFMAFIFASLPPFLMFLIFQKKITGGVNVGGVKG